MDTPDYYVLTIDTDTFAGSFEREMCAWITGQYGECTVGDDLAALAQTEMPPEFKEWCENNVAQVPDDSSCSRPCAIQPTPGWFNDGMGHNYRLAEWGTPRVKEVYEKACRDYAEKAPLSYVEHLRPKVTERAQERLTEQLTHGPGKHSAYMSVGIFLNEEPSVAMFALMVERAHEYQERNGSLGERYGHHLDFKIEGIRLVGQKTVVLREDIWKA